MESIKKFSKENALYIAGLFDGEGSIGLIKLSRLQERGKTPTYTLKVRVRMTDKDVVQWLHAVIGGNYYGQRKNNSGNLPYYEWGVAGRQGIAFLKQVYPYLKVKRIQAEIAFEYGKTFVSSKGKSNSERILDHETIMVREGLRNGMLRANNAHSKSYVAD